MMALQVALQNVKEYLKKKIAEIDALIDTRDNSGVGDILIKPQNAILQPFADELVRVDTNQSLLNGETMTETDLDALIANIFLTRRPGSKARGQVRIYFSDPTSVSVPLGSEFTSADGQSFFSLADVTITANQMSVNKDGDFYYVDILVQAETVGEAGNIAVGSIVDFVGGPSTILKVDNLSIFSGGTDREENAALTARAKSAITVRDLVSKPAIQTVLLENFDSLRDLRVVGYGDPEMERDFLIGNNLTLGLFPPVDLLGSTVGVHIGGKVDIYIRVVTLSEESIRIDDMKEITILRPKDGYDSTVDPANVKYLSTVKRPIVDFLELQEVDPVTGDAIGSPLTEGTQYTIAVDNKTVRFSPRERLRITLLDLSFVGSSFTLGYRHSPETVTIQQFVDSDEHRVVTADLLTKFTNPAFVDLSIAYTLGPAATITNDEMAAKIAAFLNDLEVGARLEASDLVDLMYDNGATFVELPFTISVEVSNSDGTTDELSDENFVEAPSTAAYLPRDIVLTQV